MLYSNKISSKIVELASQNNNDVKKNADIYVYLVNSILEQTIFFVTLLIIGLFLHNIIFNLLFFIIFFTYRGTGGGYHASSPILCTILSYTAYFAVYIFCFKIRLTKSTFTLILYILSVIFMLICPFSDCKNRRRTEEQKKSLKSKQIIFITAFSLVGFIFYCVNKFLYFKLIMISTYIICITQAIGFIQMRIDKGGFYDF